MLNGLDIFSGIGGLSEALSSWVRPVVYCENDRHAQAVLLSRMARGDLFSAPIWDDVRTLRGSAFGYTEIDIIYGGFPCQDISSAGTGKGLEGERSGLFFELSRLVHEIRPRFVFLENVPVITTRGLGKVAGEFTKLGYDTRWTIVSAKEVGASHLRKRWFMLAYANGESLRLSESRKWEKNIYAPTALENGKDTDSYGVGGKTRPMVRDEQEKPFSIDLLEGDSWDDYASFFHRVDHGIPFRSHRLRGLGNAVVPKQAKKAFEKLIGLEKDRK